MELPVTLGLDAFGERILSDTRDLLVRWQGGGYPSDHDSARVRELLAWAFVIALCDRTLDSVGENTFPDRASELLLEHEIARGLPNDAGRSVAQRQARLRALMALRAGPSAADIVSAVTALTGAVTPSAMVATRAAHDDSGDTAASIHQMLLLLGEDMRTPAILRATEWVLDRWLPAIAFGQLRHHEAHELVARAATAVWNGTSTYIGLDAIPEDGKTWVQNRGEYRIKDFALTTRINARDLLALRRGMMLGVCNLQTSIVSNPANCRRFFFALSGASAAVEREILAGDYRERLVRVWLRYSGTSDIRPGQAGDIDCNGTTAASTGFEALWYTGDGTAPYDLTVAANFVLRATATRLSIIQTTGSTQRVVGFLELTDDLNAGGGTGVLVSQSDGQTAAQAGFNAAWLSDLRKGSLCQAAAGGSCDTWTGYPTTGPAGVYHGGGLQKLAHVGYAVGSGAATWIVLDASEDWRDRIVQVEFTGYKAASTTPSAPGFPNDALNRQALNGCIGYTGTGTAVATTPGLGNYDIIPTTGGGLGIAIAARDTDGALMVGHSFPNGDAASLLIKVTASDQLAERSAASPLYLPDDVTNLDAVEPCTLNSPQDAGGALVQVEGLPPSFGVDEVLSEATPLGPICQGDPPIALEWTMKRTDSEQLTRATEERGTYKLRQKVAGSIRRVFDNGILPGTETIDTSEDWRDRVVYFHAISSSSDLRPYQVGDTGINVVASQHRGGWYTGPGGASYNRSIHATSEVTLQVNATTGALEMVNSSAGTRYACGWLHASFKLGPRST